MKITKLQVQDFEGLTALEVTPSEGVNLVEGHNGVGKTSLLEAIRVAFTNKGQRTRLVHDNNQQGTILFELDDGTQGSRRVDNAGYTAGPVSLHKNGRQIGSAQAFLNKMGLGFGFNPLSFIEMKSAEQTQMLLEVTPVDMTAGDLVKLTGGPIPEVNYQAHPLQVLNEIEKYLMEQRRQVGRDKRDTEGMVDKLRSKVPETFDRESAQSFNVADAYTRLHEIENLRNHVNRKRSEITQVDSQIEMLQERIRDLQKTRDDNLASLRSLETQLDAIPEGTVENLQSGITTYEQNSQYLQTLREADEREGQVAGLQDTYDALSETIDQVRAKPGELLERSGLPVDGLAIDESGEVTIRGLPISELSTGEQLDIAVDIAVATLGELRVVLVDGIERLDSNRQEQLLRKLSEAGVQAFIARVSDSELTVITDVSPDTSVVPF